MDLAVNDYSMGEEVTQWVRVQSSDPAHLKLAEYFTKGRILTIQGNVKIDQWEGKDGTVIETDAVERTTYYHCEHCQECDTLKILLHNIMLH